MVDVAANGIRSAFRDWHLIALPLVVFAFVSKPVPFANEWVYLPMLTRAWDASFLANDWLFSRDHAEHFVFNTLFGLLTFVMSIEAIGWIGRIASWTMIIVGLLKLGNRIGISDKAMSIAISLWVWYGQSIVSGEFVFGGFEAKSVSYVCVIFSLVGFLDRRHRIAAALLGAAFSFHPAVGMWSALAVGLSLLVNRHPLRVIAEVVGITFVGSLPGLIPVLTMTTGGMTAQEARYLVQIHMPFHIDPLAWPKADWFLYGAMMTFCVLHTRSVVANSDDSDTQSRFRFLLGFQAAACVFFTAGIAARYAEQFTFLSLFPFRLFGVIAPLFFFMFVAHALSAGSKFKLRKSAMAVGAIAIACLANPLEPAKAQVAKTARTWLAPADPLGDAMTWISQNTERDCVVILPPWRKDSYYLAQRAQVVTWRFVPYGDITEFRQRVEELVGPDWQVFDGRSVPQLMKDGYGGLAKADVATLADKYDATYFVSHKQYGFEVVHRSGEYRVYRID